MKLIKKINSECGNCLARRCGDSGCRVKLDRINSKHIIISGTRYQRYFRYKDKLCDFILFDCNDDGTYRLAVIDLKGGKLDIFDIPGLHKQLQNGANIAEKLSASYKVGVFMPVTVKKKRIDVMARKTLLMNKKYWVRFKEFLELIEIFEHNESLKFG
jgi:hypothetical protein